MTTDLLLREHWDPSLSGGENPRPIMGEFIINPDTKPFIVSGSSNRVIWVPKPIKNTIRAGVRDDDVGEFYWDVVQAVVRKGQAAMWGNSFDHRKKGIEGAITYVQDFDLGEVDLLCSENRSSYLKRYFKQYDHYVVDWLPSDWVVVVPKDRSYLGWIADIEDWPEHYISVVHNPSRAIAVARKQQDEGLA